jgi:hypothetical protein
MLEFLRRKDYARGMQLVVTGYCRWLYPSIPIHEVRRSMETGRAGEGNTAGALSRAVGWLFDTVFSQPGETREMRRLIRVASDCIVYADHPQALQLACVLLRCVFGNPFRPSAVLPAAVLAWSDRAVRRIAGAIDAEQAFDRMPILADALLDAGCDDEELMTHLRSPGPHVRGCWALDLVLGKS